MSQEQRPYFTCSPKIVYSRTWAAGALLFVAYTLFAAANVMSLDRMIQMNSEFSMNIVGDCEEFAKKKDKNLAIAVVDSGGHLLAFSRMDGVLPGVGEIARWKATSAALYGMPTKQFQKLAEKDQFMFHLPNAAPVGGGEPVMINDGKVAGAVGVSGASAEFDAECAKAGIAAALSAD